MDFHVKFLTMNNQTNDFSSQFNDSFPAGVDRQEVGCNPDSGFVWCIIHCCVTITSN